MNGSMRFRLLEWKAVQEPVQISPCDHHGLGIACLWPIESTAL
ncbi:riboflavin biosynthesis protein RibD [Alicyclobacillus hesperidum URH17-3-68]|nr:hypothetical protein [Alicyclobacillus hesperidum]EJY54526.1 riboflavin biosynthesis protein RibD [Alicyclobacillus hesperidum URH17-3-68]